MLHSLLLTTFIAAIYPFTVLAVPHGDSTQSTLGGRFTIVVEDDESPSRILSDLDRVRAFHRKHDATLLDLSYDDDGAATTTTIKGNVTATPDDDQDSEYLFSVDVGIPPRTYTSTFANFNYGFTLYAPLLGEPGSTLSTTVTIGGMTVENQLVTLVEESKNNNNIVALLYTEDNFYTNAVKQGVISPVFTADLKKGAPGTFGFGYIDTTAYKEDIIWRRVITINEEWEFHLSGYAVGSGDFVPFPAQVSIDTGTSWMYLPKKFVSAYYKQVDGAFRDDSSKNWRFPCSAALPDLVLGVGKYRLTVPGIYINYGSGNKPTSTCTGALQADPRSRPFGTLGLSFIKTHFVVFEGIENPRLGFAEKA